MLLSNCSKYCVQLKLFQSFYPTISHTAWNWSYPKEFAFFTPDPIPCVDRFHIYIKQSCSPHWMKEASWIIFENANRWGYPDVFLNGFIGLGDCWLEKKFSTSGIFCKIFLGWQKLWGNSSGRVSFCFRPPALTSIVEIRRSWFARILRFCKSCLSLAEWGCEVLLQVSATWKRSEDVRAVCSSRSGRCFS